MYGFVTELLALLSKQEEIAMSEVTNGHHSIATVAGRSLPQKHETSCRAMAGGTGQSWPRNWLLPATAAAAVVRESRAGCRSCDWGEGGLR